MEADSPGPGLVTRLAELLARLTPFERAVAEAAVDRLLRERESPAARRRRAQELERRRLINSGLDPREAADQARGGPPRAPWVRRGGDGRDLRVPRGPRWGP